jgi:hypothetical protein
MQTARSQWVFLGGLLSVIVAVEVLHGARLDWTRWEIGVFVNSHATEGYRWWSGRLDLGEQPSDTRETAHLADGDRWYAVGAPGLSIVAFLLTLPLPIREFNAEAPSLLVAGVFGFAVIVLAYVVFFRATHSVPWAVVWTLAYVAGTAVLRQMEIGRGGDGPALRHLLSQIGLLLIALDLLGPKRIGSSLFGLVIAAWARPLTILYAPALFYAAKAPAKHGRGFRDVRGRRNVILIAATLALIIAVPAVMNALKFGNPFDTGYRYVYQGREDFEAQNYHRYGLFSWRYVPENAFYMLAAVPRVARESGGLEFRPYGHGGALWLSSPLVVLAWLGLRRWWGDPVRRWLMLGSVFILVGILCYHTTGQPQAGYYRFALDVIPIWMAMAASAGVSGWRRWGVPALAAWGVGYFIFVV